MTDPTLPDIDIARWSRCELEALHGPDKRSSTARHVAAVVSEDVRAVLAGSELPTPGMYDEMRMDAITPIRFEIPRQVDMLAQAVRDALDREGLKPSAGHACEDVYITGIGSSHYALVRITHAPRLTHQWLDLAKALTDEPLLADVSFGVLVHAPRVAPGKDVHAAITTRTADSLRGVWHAWAKRVSGILHSEQAALPRPGDHCRRCMVDWCGVRAS